MLVALHLQQLSYLKDEQIAGFQPTLKHLDPKLLEGRRLLCCCVQLSLLSPNVLFYSYFLLCRSVPQSCPTLCSMNCSTLGFPAVLSLSPRVCSCPLSPWCHPSISFSVSPFSSCPQPFSLSGSFSMSRLPTLGGQSIGASASGSVLPMNTQHWFPLDGLVGSPSCPRDSQESSPAPQFESIHSSALSLLYGSTLTFIHDY